MQADVEGWEEDQRGDALNPIVAMHQNLPIFSYEYDEDGSDGHVESVKVGPRS